MNKIIRYWNQNRKKIIIIIAIIAFIIIMLNVINYMFKQMYNSPENVELNIEDRQKPTQSVITGQNVSKDITEENINIIKEFVDYCNNNEPEKAYELLSNDCKAEFNNNINTFINNYYKKKFPNQKNI